MQHRVDDWWHSDEIQYKKPVDRWDKVIIAHSECDTLVNWILKLTGFISVIFENVEHFEHFISGNACHWWIRKGKPAKCVVLLV